MTTSKPNAPGVNIPAGDIEFFDKIMPPLLAGDYDITLSQSLDYGSGNESFQKTQSFSVQAPRFKLPVADVQSVYPANGSTGKFEHKLPQIVMNKRALPWEHVLEPGDNSGAPWMALLVFSGPEILTPQNSTNPPTETFAASFPLGQVRNLNNGGVLGPAISHLDYGQTDEETVSTIDISTDTFLSVVPHLAGASTTVCELCSLAHVREVNMEHKEILKMTHSGWFSVLVANRFPINPDKPTKQYVHLVSLEGFKPYLEKGATFPHGIVTVRLISLYSWSFTSLPDHGESFSSFMLHLVSDDSEQNTDLEFRLPLDPAKAAKDNSPGKIASKALKSGYVPTSYSTRYGEKTMAWYRGPLSPVKLDDFTKTSDSPHFTASSDAVIFDPTTGLFDMSYSVAWQTGRLMALASQAFSTNLLDWRRKINRIIDLLANLAEHDNLVDFLKTYDGDINDWFHYQLITNKFLDYLLDDFAKETAPNVNSNPVTFDNSAPTNTAAPGNLPQQLKEELDKLMTSQVVIDLMHDIEGREYQNIVEWLARTALLYDVPFDHLVPNPKLLPIESIRFFYLDRSWINSMIDGAMSVGVRSSRDSNYYKATKNLIRDAVYKLILEFRENLLGLPKSDNDPTDGVVSGFLLRSAVLTQYPGIEIKAYKKVSQNDEGTPEGAERMKTLRMDRLSANVMLCLFPDTPAWIEFDEPKEGLEFGVEPKANKLEIAIRNISDGETIANTFYTLDAGDFRGEESMRVLDVNHLNLGLAGKLNKTALNSAEFALQMVKVPEQMVFQNKQKPQ
ncbi:MAG: hypothetical protein AAFZ63_10100 [Bacteroidota bacterium]